MANIAVIGAGGWGTALAVMAHQYGNTVSLWSPFEEEVAAIRRHDEHKKLLPGVAVPPSIRLTTNIACAAGADLVIMAVPSFAIRSTAARLADVVKPATIIANAGKGLEDATLKRFRRQRDMVLLQPENPAYEPKLIPLSDFETGAARIVGVAVRLVREL